MALNLAKRVIELLTSNPEKRFTAREIATWIYKTYPGECNEKRKRSTAKVVLLDSDAAFIQQLVAEIGSQHKQILKHEGVKSTEGRPRQFYYSTLTDEAEIASINTKESPKHQGSSYSEADLYPVLSIFLRSELGVLSKRIDEKRASNGHGPRGNHWLFPDVVGMEDLSEHWHKEIKDLVKETSDQKTKCWSFEVKKLINRSNVREAYFQAVSNSSWANFGYLVVSEIRDAEKEIRILAGVHGIGLIKLDVASPADSEIMIPAQEKAAINWNTANRLAEENADFLDYIKLIRQFYQTGDQRLKDWDMTQEGN